MRLDLEALKEGRLESPGPPASGTGTTEPTTAQPEETANSEPSPGLLGRLLGRLRRR